MAGPWVQALDEQLNLIRFWKGANGVPFARKILSTIKQSPYGQPVGDWTPEDLAEGEVDRLMHAETYFVRRDMGELVTRSCQSRSLIPQPLKKYHLPTPSGFVYFQDEILLPFEGGVIPIKAVVWKEKAIAMGTWPEGDRVLGTQLSVYQARDGIMSHPHNGYKKVEIDQATHPKLWLMNFHGWPYDIDWYGGQFDAGADEFTEPLAIDAEIRRFMAAFWSHVQTTVYVYSNDEPVDKHAQKRAVRSGFREIPTIRCIVLRKKRNRQTEPSNGDGSKRELTHRYIRIAHWRNQWYPKTQEHHQIWIDEQIVGNENLPFPKKAHVYDWRR
jgi:hypothetical protein